LSHLDASLRDEMQFAIKRPGRESRTTSLFVTHDQPETLSMSDRVGVLNHGVVQQIGTPDGICRKPANGLVAGFIGRSNRLHGRVEGSDADGTRMRFSREAVVLSAAGGDVQGAEVDVVIRPQAAPLSTSANAMGLPAKVVLRTFLASL
jgi:ABC-type Fe3+/spermidine/putrescine transport system ATPase subunit